MIHSMRHLWKKILRAFSLSGIIIALVPVIVFAQSGNCGDQYCNPLGNVTEIPKLIQSIIHQVLLLTIPLAGLGIVVAGLNYILAAVAGNPGRATQAKKIFFYVVIGCFIVVGALTVAEAIIKFLQTLQ